MNAADHLIKLGYLKFIPEAEHALAKSEMLTSLGKNYLATAWDDDFVSRDRRSYPADGEEAAEGGLGTIIRLMEPVLRQEGVELTQVEDNFADDAYYVVVDGDRQLVYTTEKAELSNAWGIATKRLLEIVNGLLEKAGSAERLYAIYGGNEGRVILLTPEMYDFLKESDLEAEWLPITASEINDDGDEII